MCRADAFRCMTVVLPVLVTIMLASCKKQPVEQNFPRTFSPEQNEHSPSVFLVMYDKEVGKEPLLAAVKKYKAEVVYDYNIINGMAIKKPDDKTLEETMEYFKSVKGVLSVEYDHIYHLTD